MDSKFKATTAAARDLLKDEIRKLGGTALIISSNVPVNSNGDLYAGDWQPDDRGVAVYFTHKGTQMCFACDKFTKVKDNLTAIAKTIEAIRGIERWGASDMMERAFLGFKQLPENASQSWRITLGFTPDQKVTVEMVDARFRELAKQYHTDTGGATADTAKFVEAREAHRIAHRELSSK